MPSVSHYTVVQHPEPGLKLTTRGGSLLLLVGTPVDFPGVVGTTRGHYSQISGVANSILMYKLASPSNIGRQQAMM